MPKTAKNPAVSPSRKHENQPNARKVGRAGLGGCRKCKFSAFALATNIILANLNFETTEVP